MLSLKSRLRKAEAAAAHDPKALAEIREGRHRTVDAILGEVLALQGGESVKRVHSARTDIDPEVVALLTNLANAIGMPMDTMLPNMVHKTGASLHITSRGLHVQPRTSS